MRLSEESPETQVIWALAACICHNLFAENYIHNSPYGVVLDGQFAQETGAVAAAALGAARAHIHRGRKEKTLDCISRACGGHDFPTLVHFAPHSRPHFKPEWLDEPSLRRAILQLPQYAAIAVASHPGFVRIYSGEFPQPLARLTDAAAWVIPNYLQDFCRRSGQIDLESHDSELMCVLSDMAEWFEQEGGSLDAVWAAREMIMADSASPTRAFAELVMRMHGGGEIACVRAGAEGTVRSKTPVAVVEQEADTDCPARVHVWPRLINRVLQRKRAPAMRMCDVQAELESQSALLGIDHDDQGEVWSIKLRWWNEMIARIRQPQTFAA